jgi:hypothetical protein
VVRIEIHNFQSIAKEVVEVDGFSAVVGRSNIGKSAVVRAVKSALTGPPSEALVRHGEDCQRILKGNKKCQCFCSVRIQAEGLDLLWEKGDNVNRYVYNGVEHTVVGKGTPDFLADGFGPVKLGDDKEVLQVSEQFSPIFILNKSGTVVADVLSDVAKLDQINTAIRLVERDRKEASSTRKVREKDVKDLEVQLEGYEGLDGVVSRVHALEKLDREVEEARSKALQLDGYISEFLTIGRRVKLLSGVESILVPDIDGLGALGSSFKKLLRFNREAREKAVAVKRLSGVESVHIPEMESFQKTGALYEDLVVWVARVSHLRAFFDKVKQYDVADPPSLDGAKAALSKLRQLSEWQRKAAKLAAVMAQAQKDLVAVEQEEADVLQEFQALGVCRTCNRPFAGDHVHA